MVRFRANGFSLVEIMIALGILSILVMGSASLFSTWVDYKKNMKASSVADQTQLEISTLLSGGTQCLANLGPAPGADVSLTSTITNSSSPIKDSNGLDIFSVGTTIGHAAEFESWSVIERANLGLVGVNTKVMADLLLTFKTVGTNGATTRQQRKISLIAVKDVVTNKILSCDVLSSFRDPASLGSQANNVDVAFQVSNPTGPLVCSTVDWGGSIGVVTSCGVGANTAAHFYCDTLGQLKVAGTPGAILPTNCKGSGWMMIQTYDSPASMYTWPTAQGNPYPMPFIVPGDCSSVTGPSYTSSVMGTVSGECP